MTEAVCLERLSVETVFDPGLVHVKFVVQNKALGQSFFRAVWLSTVTHDTNALHSQFYFLPSDLKTKTRSLEYGEGERSTGQNIPLFCCLKIV